MSAREGLAAVLRAHVLAPAGLIREPFCTCGWQAKRPRDADGNWRTAQHRAHLAGVILRDWLPTALADERVVEAVHKAIACNILGPVMQPAATAALTAAVTALREDR